MLKKIFLQKLHTKSSTVHNAIIQLGDTDDSGKGKKFKSRFIQPGLANYPESFGMALIRKENFDKFIKTLETKSVIINHHDLTENNYKDFEVGKVFNVWYNDKDGWYWCDGIIDNETAINLIQDKGWSVSCSYDVKLADDAGGTENNVPYDIEFLDGVFTHLAIVDNPRYERANIVFNSKTVINNQFREEEHPRDENGRFTSGGNGVNPDYKTELKQVIDKAKNNPTEHQKLVIGKVAKDLEEKAKDNGFDISGYQHDLDVSGTRHAIKEHGQPKTEEPRGQIAITDEDFEKIPDVIYGYDEVSFTGKNKIGRETITYKKAFDDGTILYVEEIRDKRKTLTINTLYKQKNTGNPRTFVENNNPLSNASIHIITDVKDDFNPNVQNIKEHEDMALIDELKKLIHKVENDKGESMKKVHNEDVDKREILREADAIAMKPASDFKGGEEEKFRTLTKKMEELSYEKSERGTSDNEKEDEKKKADNEKTDKRELIREIGGILKGKVDEEDIRTIIKKAEEIAYNPSERSKADNESEKDKEEYNNLKKEIKEDAENKKCNNSINNSKGRFFDKLNEVYNSSMEPPKQDIYVSRSQRLEAGKKY
jgi:hypothetical protein|nr:MAG TPA: nuclease [Caudoviricetes sp.]